MTVDDVIRNFDLLKQNFDNLLTQLGATAPPDPDLQGSLLRMHTTHTFGHEKTFNTGPASARAHSVYPYRTILLDGRGLLSEHYRRRTFKHITGEPARKMTKARAYGLDHYVFAYLGLHEYYYAQSDGMSIPAYGAFLSPSLDYDSKANSTLYDLESKLAIGYEPKEITLSTNDARLFTANEIPIRYDNDLFTYWICPEYADKHYYDEHMWAHKREFHYHEKVELADIEAILWPVQLVAGDDPDTLEIRYDISAEIAEFRRNNSSIIVYKYVWRGADGQDRFSLASWIISEYCYKHNCYPTETYFSDIYYRIFPIP